jgi:hypothetical protein
VAKKKLAVRTGADWTLYRLRSVVLLNAKISRQLAGLLKTLDSCWMVFPRKDFFKFAYNFAQDVHTTRTFND